MGIELRWLGHGGWGLKIDDYHVLVDPFLTENPVATESAAEIAATHILVSHGHFDHIADVATIAKRTGATVVAVYEVAQWLQAQQVEHTIGMNTGGGIELPFGRVTLTPAWHSSQLPDGSYGGNPVGFVVHAAGCRLYFACDTALFSDMSLIGAQGIDVAVLPIGDMFTMGIADSLRAIELLAPRLVLPAHYNTWPPIAQDAQAWAELVRSRTQAEPVVLQPGESYLVRQNS